MKIGARMWRSTADVVGLPVFSLGQKILFP